VLLKYGWLGTGKAHIKGWSGTLTHKKDPENFPRVFFLKSFIDEKGVASVDEKGVVTVWAEGNDVVVYRASVILCCFINFFNFKKLSTVRALTVVSHSFVPPSLLFHQT
jgi:hypothetical protein